MFAAEAGHLNLVQSFINANARLSLTNKVYIAHATIPYIYIFLNNIIMLVFYMLFIIIFSFAFNGTLV